MRMRTHLAIGATLALYFFPYVSNKWIFIPVILISSLIPDIDNMFSFFGGRLVTKPLHFFVKHRGIIHSFTVCIIFSGLLAFFYPIFALPFFLGYSFHLFADSFTVWGIKPFWPFKTVSKGILRTGSMSENVVFVMVVIFDLLLAFQLIF